MTSWNVQFANATPGPWVGSIWQEAPAGLTAVSWLQARVLPGGTASFDWDDERAVVLATYEDAPSGGIYSPLEPSIRKALPSSAWDVITINLVDYLAVVDDGGEPGPIGITNRSMGPVNAGVMQGGAAVAYAGALPVEKDASFPEEMQLNFGLFADLQQGQVIQRALVVAGPLVLAFPPGITRLLVTAALQGSTIVLSQVPA